MNILANLVNLIPTSVGGEISFMDQGRVEVEAHLDSVSFVVEYGIMNTTTKRQRLRVM
jgi:hypothetical protein